MKSKYSFKEKREIIIDYIKKRPKATRKEIKNKVKLHLEVIFRYKDLKLIN